MINLLKAAALGVLQGLTEFLPVSSTAHLLIGSRLIGYGDPGGVFTVMIQLGSIFAVMWLYREKILAVVTGLPTSAEARRFAFMIVLATVPALVAGFFFSKFVKSVLYGSFVVIALAFIIGGAIMLMVERFRPAPDVMDVDSLPVGRAMRVDRPAAAEFTFFLAMPTMAAAFAHDLLEVRHNLGSARALEIAVGFVMAFIASALVVKPFLQYVRRSGFAPFAWYRIALGLVLLAAVAAGWM
jgi:undecaprenyl-diphosphatase